MCQESTELLWIGCLTGLTWSPKIQIRYMDTKHQLADILTKGNFTRDEWNNLPHLFTITHFSSTCCTKNFSLTSCSTLAKRIQAQEEERVVSKLRPAMMNISSFFIATSSCAASSPIASKSPGMPIASEKPRSRMSVEPSSFDAASTSQVRLKDAYLGGLMEKLRVNRRIKKKKIQKTHIILRLRSGTTKGNIIRVNLLPKTVKLGEQPLAHGASSSVDKESQKNTEATCDHYLHVSPDTSHFMEAVFSKVRKIHGKPLGDLMEDLNVNFGHSVNVHEYHSSSSNSSRKRL